MIITQNKKACFGEPFFVLMKELHCERENINAQRRFIIK